MSLGKVLLTKYLSLFLRPSSRRAPMSAYDCDQSLLQSCFYEESRDLWGLICLTYATNYFELFLEWGCLRNEISIEGNLIVLGVFIPTLSPLSPNLIGIRQSEIHYLSEESLITESCEKQELCPFLLRLFCFFLLSRCPSLYLCVVEVDSRLCSHCLEFLIVTQVSDPVPPPL